MCEQIFKYIIKVIFVTWHTQFSMGKGRKRFNWKGREQKEVVVEDRDAENVVIEWSATATCDESNALVTTSTRKTKPVARKRDKKVVKLSKKQRRQLEAVLKRKQKKVQRSVILEKLKEVEATAEERALLGKINQIHSGTFKRHADDTPQGDEHINAVIGSGRKRRKKMDDEVKMNDEDESSNDESSEGFSTEDEDPVSDEGQSQDQPAESIEDRPEKDARVPETVKTAPSEENNEASVQSGQHLRNTEQAVICDSPAPKPAVFVPVDRSGDIQRQRLALPILKEEQAIMEMILENTVCIICGPTGSGKTTQVPQFLYEAGYTRQGRIAVTEPRRVAAITMSQRVAMELCLTSEQVSYQIRYEGNTTDSTLIKFMTDGVLLREIQNDFLLTQYSVVIIDEAHERSVFTDILIGLLSRIVQLRQKKGKPLKMIIMSATLRVEDFTTNKHLFKVTPPVFQVESRQHPVEVHFNKRTPDDYMAEAYRKTCKIHQKLPPGGILVFVTGQQEVNTLCARLRRTFPKQRRNAEQLPVGDSDNKDKLAMKARVKLEDFPLLPEEGQAEVALLDDEEDEDNTEVIEDVDDSLDEDDVCVAGAHPLHVLPLYSLLPAYKQSLVFEPPPDGTRLCVVATNVAETSITIPAIRYVVDTGRTKTKFFDNVTGVAAFRVVWESKASADQRAGRAGRTRPGHAYRLFSSAVFSDFVQFSEPEIVRRPIDDLVLQMKSMCIDKVVNFPFPTCPSLESLQAAEKLLVSLGALQEPLNVSHTATGKTLTVPKITALGSKMAAFPVAPRFSKILVSTKQSGLLPYVIALVAAMSVQELVLTINPGGDTEEDKARNKKALQQRKSWAGKGNARLLGDMMVMLKAVIECSGGSYEDCLKYGVRHKAMKEVQKLRVQLTNIVNTVLPSVDVLVDPGLAPPADAQCHRLRQLVTAALGDRVAKKTVEPTATDAASKKLRNSFQCTSTTDPVFIHPGSVLYKQKCQYVVYQQLEETSKLYMKGVVCIDPSWLPVYCTAYCTLSEPQDDPSPCLSSDGKVQCYQTAKYGPHCWPLDAVLLPYPDGLPKYKWFAKLLLEGKVFPTLSQYADSLLSRPVTMVKSWAKLQPRTDSILKALVGKQVNCKQSLQQVWQKEPKYLLTQYKEWLPQSLHDRVEQLWPPMDIKT